VVVDERDRRQRQLAGVEPDPAAESARVGQTRRQREPQQRRDGRDRRQRGGAQRRPAPSRRPRPLAETASTGAATSAKSAPKRMECAAKTASGAAGASPRTNVCRSGSSPPARAPTAAASRRP